MPGKAPPVGAAGDDHALAGRLGGLHSHAREIGVLVRWHLRPGGPYNVITRARAGAIQWPEHVIALVSANREPSYDCHGARAPARTCTHLWSGRPSKWAALRVRPHGASLRRGRDPEGLAKPVAHLRHSRRQLAGQDGAPLARPASDVRAARRPDEPRGRGPAAARVPAQHERRHHDAQPSGVSRGPGGRRAARRRGGQRLVAVDGRRARVPGAALRGQGDRVRGRPVARRGAGEEEPPGDRRQGLHRRRRGGAGLRPLRGGSPRSPRHGAPRRVERRGGRGGRHLHLGNDRKAEGRRSQVPEGRDARQHAVHRRDADAHRRHPPRHVPALPLHRVRLPGVHGAARRNVGAHGRVQAGALPAARRASRRDDVGGRADDPAPRDGAGTDRSRPVRRAHRARHLHRRRAAAWRLSARR